MMEAITLIFRAKQLYRKRLPRVAYPFNQRLVRLKVTEQTLCRFRTDCLAGYVRGIRLGRCRERGSVQDVTHVSDHRLVDQQFFKRLGRFSTCLPRKALVEHDQREM